MDNVLLDRAYRYCAAITALHSRSFDLAMYLLPRPKRRAMRALYAFCRVTDDIVDSPLASAVPTLAGWHEATIQASPPSGNPVAMAWADTRARFRIPIHLAEQLIDGVARDLRQNRYATFGDLVTYAYGVASTVGLMSMYIIGFAGRETVPHMVKLGVALQITNILRDVGEDLHQGRIYLPADELASYDLTERDLFLGKVDSRWRSFMRFQIARNRRLYAEAWPGIALLDVDGRFAVAAAADFYRAILHDIERHDYDVFSRRAHVSAWGKLRRLPGIWRRVPRSRNVHAAL